MWMQPMSIPAGKTCETTNDNDGKPEFREMDLFCQEMQAARSSEDCWKVGSDVLK